jgi:hypothetical protein
VRITSSRGELCLPSDRASASDMPTQLSAAKFEFQSQDVAPAGWRFGRFIAEYVASGR